MADLTDQERDRLKSRSAATRIRTMIDDNRAASQLETHAFEGRPNTKKGSAQDKKNRVEDARNLKKVRARMKVARDDERRRPHQGRVK